MANNRVQEVAASTRTQWDQAMAVGDAYTVAGSAVGTPGSSGDGDAAATALLDQPGLLALSASGDLYIADWGNNRAQEVPAGTGTQWGQAMTAGDMYTVAGSASGAHGRSGDGGPAGSSLLSGLNAVSLDAAGDLYISDSGNNVVREVPASTTTAYTWDQADRLVAAAPGASALSYSYDGDGLLRGRATVTGTATLTWDTTSGVPLLLSDGTYDYLYLYGPDGTPVEEADIATEVPEYFVSDDQGSTRALLGAGGSVDATFTYDAYGNLTASTGTATTPLLYGGQYRDLGTRLYYLRARWYDPATDQFLSIDPEVSETEAPYDYAGDDPVNSDDLSGLNAGGPCLTGSAAAALGFQGSACVVRLVSGLKGKGDAETMESAGLSAGLQVGADVGGSWTISDATDLDQLGKWFYYFQIGGDYIAGLGPTVFWSTNWDPTDPFKAGTVFGAELGPPPVST
jgi:RHS repeat-associated protein